MIITTAINQAEWEQFLFAQKWSPFLQSWQMGEVYREVGEEPVRMIVRDSDEIIGICQAIVVRAKRGDHIAVMYGPVIVESSELQFECCKLITEELVRIAKQKRCGFVRMSPFWNQLEGPSIQSAFGGSLGLTFKQSPLHLLAEHIWYLDLKGKTEQDILMGMRKTTRNLVRRAEREGVIVELSENPLRDLPIFFDLYEETRKRHGFVPYSESFIEAQVRMHDGAQLYIARMNGEAISASVHMRYGGEMSYHHGASSSKYSKSYASYFLQWTAIKDAIACGDHVYNFWGIAPVHQEENGKWRMENERHPFGGVTTFKTGFGGQIKNLVHCFDIPVSKKYYFTRWFEMCRKWKRGF